MRKLLVIMTAAMTMSMLLTGCRAKDYDEIDVRNHDSSSIEKDEDDSDKKDDEAYSDNPDFTAGNKDSQEFLEKINSETAEYQGVCGPDARWFYLDNVIVVKGTGEVNQATWMDSFVDGWDVDSSKLPVWVIFDEGITEIDTAINGERYNNKLVKILLPTTLVSIGKSAFKKCTALERIVLPEGVTSIGDWAFSGCESLTEINLPEGITSIGENTFDYCKSLTEINLPEGITSIGDGAFSGCRSLSEITIPKSVTSIGAAAFNGCNITVHVPQGFDTTQISGDGIEIVYY